MGNAVCQFIGPLATVSRSRATNQSPGMGNRQAPQSFVESAVGIYHGCRPGIDPHWRLRPVLATFFVDSAPLS